MSDPPRPPASAGAPVAGRGATDDGTLVVAPELVGLADFRVLRKLGQGGMGAVYLAHNPHANKAYVLKVIRTDFLAQPGMRERFLREVRAAVALGHHAHIVTAYPPVSAGGVLAHVMEFVDGVDLATLVRQRGPLAVPVACSFVAQAARGLQHAHAHGLVHRDIKPHNLLLTRSGDRRLVKVADFGLAKQVEDQTGDQLTGTGASMGTPDYMAPEQARDASRADIRADIYSLGCTLHFLLTGRPPYPGGSAMDKLLRHMQEPFPAIRDSRPEVPETLAAVLGRMTAKRVEDRFQTPGEVATALTPFAKPVATPPAPPPPPRQEISVTPPLPKNRLLAPWHGLGSGRRRATLAAVGAIGLGLVAVILIPRSSPPRQPDGAPAAAAPARVPAPLPPGGMPFPPTADPGWTNDGRSARQNTGAGWHGWPSDAPKPAIAPFTIEQAHQYREAWAKYLGVPGEYVNSIGMKFHLIPPGVFVMGGTPEEIETALGDAGVVNDTHVQQCIRSEHPRHTVILTQPIYLGISEVTQAEYELVMGDNPSRFRQGGVLGERVAGLDTSTLPVESVRWIDAVTFCDRLSEREHLQPSSSRSGEPVPSYDGTGYRLPTEAQWEFGCRAGTLTTYWTGTADEDLKRTAWFGGNSGGRPHAVRELQANPFGLFDMHGNVWEWVEDAWDAMAYQRFADSIALNPRPAFSERSPHIVRGGEWYDRATFCRSSQRGAPGKTFRFQNVGFRVSLVVDAVRQALKLTSDRQIAAATPASRPPVSGPAPVPPSGAPVSVAQAGRPEPATDTVPVGPARPLSAPFDAAEARLAQRRWAAKLGQPAERYNRLDMKLALIPPGDFDMGNEFSLERLQQLIPYAKSGWFVHAEPRRRVRITRPFYLGKYEVTIGQFRRFVTATGYQTEAERDGLGGSGYSDGDVRTVRRFTWRDAGFDPPPTDLHPVVNVSWNDAVAFCNWLSREEGRPEHYATDGRQAPAGGRGGYRLPTEAEWEYACRAGTTTMYANGDDTEALVAIGNTADAACAARLSTDADFHPITANDGYAFTAPTGKFAANNFGLHDLHGNAAEWCADAWAPDAYARLGPDDPRIEDVGNLERVTRGGNWRGSSQARSARRKHESQSARAATLGFRVALDVELPAASTTDEP